MENSLTLLWPDNIPFEMQAIEPQARANDNVCSIFILKNQQTKHKNLQQRSSVAAYV
jgi:hypothetical protein